MKSDTQYKPSNAKATADRQTEIGEIPEDWNLRQLKELADFSNGYAFSSRSYTEKSENAVPVFKMGNIDIGGGIKITGKEDYADQSLARKLASYITDKDDILMCMTDMKSSMNLLGHSARINNEKFLVNQRVGRIRPNSNVDSAYLYYYLNSRSYIERLRTTARSGVQVNLTTEAIKESWVKYPPIGEQQQIASILSSLDDKIELNRRMNKTLEEIGKTLFKRWFVDFEFPNENGKPYKSSGGEMVESELGEIPKGWEASRVREIATLKSGFAFKGSSFKDSGKYGVIKIKNIIDPDVDVTDIQFVSEEEVKDRTRQFILNSGDILIAMSGNTTGKIGILVKGDYELVLNQRVGKYFLKNSNYHWYLYFLLRSGDIQKSIVEKAYGSAQPNISPDILESVSILLPGNNILKSFEKLIVNLMEKYISNQKEVYVLSEIRDSLLPRLMSGRIRVN